MGNPVNVNEYILLEPGEETKYRLDTPSWILHPSRLADGRYVLRANVLETTELADWIPHLLAHRRCKVDPNSNEVVAGSEYAPERTPPVYLPKENPWDRPPFPGAGDWSEAKLYESVGRTLSAWETVEVELANLFVALLSPLVYRLPAQLAYGGVASASARIELVRQAASAYFEAFPNKATKAEFARVMKLSEKYAGRRNDIAHGFVDDYESPDGIMRGAALLPPIYASNKRKLVPAIDPAKYEPRTKPIYAYTSVEIAYFIERFRELASSILKLSEAMNVQLHQGTPGDLFEKLAAHRQPPPPPDGK